MLHSARQLMRGSGLHTFRENGAALPSSTPFNIPLRVRPHRIRASPADFGHREFIRSIAFNSRAGD